MKKLIKTLLIFLGFIILVMFLFSFDKESFRLIIQKVNARLFLIVISLIFLNIAVKALRWKLLIKETSKKNISAKFSFLSILGGVAAGSYIPGRVEMAKPLMLKEKGVSLAKSFSALFIERIFDFLGLIFILIISLLIIPEQNIIGKKIILGGVIGLVLITFVIAFFPQQIVRLIELFTSFLPLKLRIKVDQFCEQFFSSFKIMQKNRLFIVLLVMSLAAHFLEISRFYLIMQFLGVDVPLALVGFVFSAVVIISILSMIPGGIGITEFSTTAILLVFMSSEILIKNSVLIDRFFSYYLLVIIGSLVLMFYSKSSNIKKVRRCPE